MTQPTTQQTQSLTSTPPVGSLAAEREAGEGWGLLAVVLAAVLALGFLARSIFFRRKPGKGGGCPGCGGGSCCS